MKPYIQEEIEVLDYNTNVVIEKLQSGSLSTMGATTAVEILKTLIKIRDFISDEASEMKRVGLLLSRLPLLYFQIPKIN